MNEMKKRRLAAGLTLAELGRRTGIDYSTVQALEAGRGTNYNIEVKKKIADALGAQGAEGFFSLWPEELKKLKHLEF
jgi:transcriptional regulator with XRE-family HTH domain